MKLDVKDVTGYLDVLVISAMCIDTQEPGQGR